jgi:DNA-binding transcriptional LysR family regulator
MLNDELSDLAIFAAVADARSFTRAAVKLGKSQSALSQSVRRLEERLKLRLLTRTTRGMMPTPAGEQLLSTLRPALSEIEAQLNALSELRELPSGSLRLTAGRRAVETVLWPALLRPSTRYPDIKVEVSIEPALTDIVAEQYDAGVRLGEQIARDMIALRIALIYGGRSSGARPTSLTTASRSNRRTSRITAAATSACRPPVASMPGTSSATNAGSTSTWTVPSS